jgi:hypothetical protein
MKPFRKKAKPGPEENSRELYITFIAYSNADDIWA